MQTRHKEARYRAFKRFILDIANDKNMPRDQKLRIIDAYFTANRVDLLPFYMRFALTELIDVKIPGVKTDHEILKAYI